MQHEYIPQGETSGWCGLVVVVALMVAVVAAAVSVALCWCWRSEVQHDHSPRSDDGGVVWVGRGLGGACGGICRGVGGEG